MQANAWTLLLLLSVLLLLGPAVHGQPPRPSFSVGSLLFPRYRPLPSTALRAAVHSDRQAGAAAGAGAAAAAAEEACTASAAADLPSRLQLPQWDPNWTPKTFEDKRQGPYLSFYPRVQEGQVPEGCNPLLWAQQRLLAAVAATIRMGLNYCHFRTPAYEAPEEVRMVCVPQHKRRLHSTLGRHTSTVGMDASSSRLSSSADSEQVSASINQAPGEDSMTQNQVYSNVDKSSSSSSSSSGPVPGPNTSASMQDTVAGARSTNADTTAEPPSKPSSRVDGGSSSSSSMPGSSGGGCAWMMTSICNSEGLSTTQHPWRGLDCSNFVAWVYNLAFGFYPATVIGEAACHPTYAPGRLLHNVSTAHLDALLPGDLVFGRQSRRHASAPSAVRHVALWTGYTVDFEDASSPFFNATLLENVPRVHWHTYTHCMARELAQGRPVYVIVDSNFAGPSYRPFCGSYLTNFSHARRILVDNTLDWPLVNHAAVAGWDPARKACISTWALVEPTGPGHRHGHVRPAHTRHPYQHVRL